MSRCRHENTRPSRHLDGWLFCEDCRVHIPNDDMHSEDDKA